MDNVANTTSFRIVEMFDAKTGEKQITERSLSTPPQIDISRYKSPALSKDALGMVRTILGTVISPTCSEIEIVTRIIHDRGHPSITSSPKVTITYNALRRSHSAPEGLCKKSPLSTETRTPSPSSSKKGPSPFQPVFESLAEESDNE
jgi:hypothetical protein